MFSNFTAAQLADLRPVSLRLAYLIPGDLLFLPHNSLVIDKLVSSDCFGIRVNATVFSASDLDRYELMDKMLPVPHPVSSGHQANSLTLAMAKGWLFFACL